MSHRSLYLYYRVQPKLQAYAYMLYTFVIGSTWYFTKKRLVANQIKACTPKVISGVEKTFSRYDALFSCKTARDKHRFHQLALFIVTFLRRDNVRFQADAMDGERARPTARRAAVVASLPGVHFYSRFAQKTWSVVPNIQKWFTNTSVSFSVAKTKITRNIYYFQRFCTNSVFVVGMAKDHCASWWLWKHFFQISTMSCE